MHRVTLSLGKKVTIKLKKGKVFKLNLISLRRKVIRLIT
jgi:hypothetical protein